MKYSTISKIFTILTFVLLSFSQLGNCLKSTNKEIKTKNILDSDLELLQNDQDSGNDTLKDIGNKKNDTKEENRKKLELEIDPLLEDDYEKYKLISSKFLGPIVPKEEIDCSHLNFDSPISDEIKKACDVTSLVQIADNRNLMCNAETCGPSQGKCNDQRMCVCEKGWLNDPNLKVNKFCSYKQKKQMLFFLIEFFAPFGLGHILYGKFYYGIIKLSVFIGLIMIDLISKCVLLCGNERGAKFPNYMTFFYYLILVFWQLFDMTMIGFNKFKDENGMPYLPVER